MLDTDRLIVLRSVAANGSIAAAARELGYTRSAISQQMSALERSAGAALLIRGGNTVTVTPLGRKLLEHTERILVELRAAEAALRQADGQVSGTLRIGVAFREGPAIMSTALTRIRQRYPQLELTLAAVTDDQASEEIRRGHLDAAIVSRFASRPPEPEPGLKEWTLGSDTLSLCVPADHSLSGRKKVAFPDLADEGWVICQANSLGRWMLRFCADAGYRPRIVASVQDVATAIGLVTVGWGITVAPELTPTGVEGAVVKIPIEGMAVRRYSVLIVRDGEQNLPEISAVVSAVHKAVADTAFER
jgi:DNA-binding transcriptional LysR family regulator